MNKIAAKLMILPLIFLFSGSSDGQDVIVDNSPDAFPGTLEAEFFNSLTNVMGTGGSQTSGDSFQLTEPVEITGGAAFAPNGGATGDFAVGDEVHFAIFGADAALLPLDTPIISEVCTVDAYDSVDTTSATSLQRYHVTLKNPVVLEPGIYFFTLPGTDSDPQIMTGSFGDGIIYVGNDSNIDFDFGILAAGIDLYFQIEGNAAATVLKGDTNLDGTVDLLDVASFVEAIANQTFFAEADTNCDGNVNLLDVNSFIELVLGN